MTKVLVTATETITHIFEDSKIDHVIDVLENLKKKYKDCRIDVDYVCSDIVSKYRREETDREYKTRLAKEARMLEKG